jgi:8-oxo-dGTP pyrophosphatase MutT (NUDIX family)
MAESGGRKEKVAAGGVILDDAADGPRVLVVHRPRYDDWSFPKGGVKGGETLERAALREVLEETGLKCEVVRKLTTARYRYRTPKGGERPKVVHYFLMKPAGGRLEAPNDEVDAAEWLSADEAERRLSYERDKELLRSLTSAGGG